MSAMDDIVLHKFWKQRIFYKSYLEVQEEAFSNLIPFTGDQRNIPLSLVYSKIYDRASWGIASYVEALPAVEQRSFWEL